MKSLTYPKIIIKNNSNETTSFRYYNVNFTEVIEPGDEIILTPSCSEALAYYISLNETAGIVSHEAPPDEDSPTEDEIPEEDEPSE